MGSGLAKCSRIFVSARWRSIRFLPILLWMFMENLAMEYAMFKLGRPGRNCWRSQIMGSQGV